jgi:leucine dehydrogenase
MLSHMCEHGHELVCFHQDEASGLRAIIAVHSTVLGPGFGGSRRWHYATERGAVDDVLRLSEGMTYKAAAADLPMGGGKAVILLPAPFHPPTRDEARAMGRFVNTLGGRYITAEDVGVTPQYVDWMAEVTQWVAGGEVTASGGDPSPHTAEGVVNAMLAALEFSGRPADLAGVHVAIQGAGNVGANVARIVHAQGGRITIADIDDAKARRVAEACGAAVAEPDEILFTECDILAPCALGGVITGSVIRRLRCPILCGGANNVLGDYVEDGALVMSSGIVHVPDFIANAGGLIELAGVVLGMPVAERRRRIAAIRATSLEVLHDAGRHASAFAAAVALARRRIEAGSRATAAH